MKEQDILQALTDIDDAYIEEAAGGSGAEGRTDVRIPPASAGYGGAKKRGVPRWLKWTGGIAAALAVCVFGAFLFSGPLSGASSAAPNTAESDNTMPAPGNMGSDYFYEEDSVEMPSESESGGYAGEYTGTENPASGDIEGGQTDAQAGALEGKEVKLIYTAFVSMQTTDFEETSEQLKELVTSLGGYYESSNVSNGSYYDTNPDRSASYAIRIPARSYRAFLDTLSADFFVTSLDESVEDVGNQYFELETRLRTLRTKEERLQTLLADATVMSDIIEIENALADTQYEIELYTTDLNRYDDLIDFSTVNLELWQVRNTSGNINDRDSFGARLSQAFTRGAQNFVAGLQNFAVNVTRNFFNIVLVLAIALIIFFAARAWIKRRRNKAVERLENPKKPE